MKAAVNNKNNKSQNNSDWVCCHCNNLNYSFRKICNRCKTMTKEQNHQNLLQMQYYQMYYQQTITTTDDKSYQQILEETQEIAYQPIYNYQRKISDNTSSAQKSLVQIQQKWLSPKSNTTECTFMSLLQNLCVIDGYFQKQNQITRQQIDQQSQEDINILTNFDFSFI